MMKITNGLTTTNLDSVNVNVNFTDGAGNAVIASSDPNNTTAAFFIRIDTITGIANVIGTATIALAQKVSIYFTMG